MHGSMLGMPALTTPTFFGAQADPSRIKAEIVSEYFRSWVRIIAPRARAGRVAYVDLYAGPGRYEDGTASTPLLVVQEALAEAGLPERLVTLFNDANPNATSNLKAQLQALDGYDKLKYRPLVRSSKVTEALAEEFEGLHTIPTLTFLDPFGYKGVTLRLIRSVVKDWGCEAIFFFNYNRINAAINNRMVENHMAGLFGEERLQRLRVDVEGASPQERPTIIFDHLFMALRDLGAEHCITFGFKRVNGRLSHYLCHVSKNALAYAIMKEIMAKKGTIDQDGIPRYEFTPDGAIQTQLFTKRPFEILLEDLRSRFSGRTLTRKQLYEEHHVGKPYIRANYRSALLRLEEDSVVTCIPPAIERPRRRGELTLAEHVRISFPPTG